MLLMALLLFSGAARSIGDLLIAPQSAAGVEGNSYQVPLDTGGPERFQQVYGSSLFGDYSQGLLIGGLVFRVDAFVGHAFSTTLSDVEIHLSTTPRSPDGLFPVFDLNVGSDDRIVVRREARPLDGCCGGGVLNAWSIFFDFRSAPFLYDPNGGNLLLDIKVFNGASTAPFDAVDLPGDSVSSAFAYGSTIPTSGQPSSLGLATLFVQVVPEPSSIALLLLGLVGVWLVARRRTSRRD
jgi:hypothetical protein